VYAAEQEALQNEQQAAFLATLAKKSPRQNVGPETQESERRKERALKMTYKEQQDFAQIDDQIAQVEEELQKNSQQMNEMGSDFGKLTELVTIQQSLEQKLDSLLERWTYLNELAEKIAQNSRRDVRGSKFEST